MAQKYSKPNFNKDFFTCPHCQTLAQMNYIAISSHNNMLASINKTIASLQIQDTVIIAKCLSCGQYIIWDKGKYIYPEVLPEEANPDMPDSVKQLYNEAGSIYSKSPRAACALLRLAIDNFCHELGENDRDINKNIGSLVQKGLPQKVKEALDLVRVIGNKAVHPGFIAFDVDDENTALQLMKLVNIITQNMVSEPKQINDMFEELPSSTKEAIEKRDKNNS
jgi:hypothetical protein